MSDHLLHGQCVSERIGPMSNYSHASISELRGRHFEFKARLRNLENGVTTDESDVEYTDPKAQADWFRGQLRAIETELSVRAYG